MGSDRERIATCCCGGLSATAREEPAHIYACSCLACQRGSGSAFSYAAIYPEDAVTVAGRASYYLQRGDSGRLTESSFCPVCGVTVCFRAKAMPGMIGLPPVVSPIRTCPSPSGSIGHRSATIGSISARMFRSRRPSLRLRDQNLAVTSASSCSVNSAG